MAEVAWRSLTSSASASRATASTHPFGHPLHQPFGHRPIERTVLAALKAGGSSREIARHVRMEGASVFAMGKRLGWPDEKEKARRAAAAEERRKWDWMKNPVE